MPRRAVHGRRAKRGPPSLRDQPRRASICPCQPARSGQGKSLRPLLAAIAQEPAAALPRRVRRRSLDIRGERDRSTHRWTAPVRSSSTRKFVEYGDDSVAQLGASTRLRAGLERAVQGARGGDVSWRTSSSRPATSHTTSGSRNGRVPLLPTARDPRLRPTGPVSSERWAVFDTYGALLPRLAGLGGRAFSAAGRRQ